MGEAKRRGTFEERRGLAQTKFMDRALKQESGNISVIKAKLIAIYNKPGTKRYGRRLQQYDELRYQRHATQLAERMGLDMLKVLQEHKESS